MKKGILTSLICFTSMVLFSCGSKTVKVTILECTNCSFENVTEARVGKDLTVQAYLTRGYELDDRSDSLDITAGNTHLSWPCYTFDKTSNKLTVDKKYIYFGDITIKGIGDVKQNNLNYVLNGGKTYDQETTLKKTEIVTVEDYDYEQKITYDSGKSIEYTDIHVSPSDVVYTYENDTLKIAKEYCYTDITITLP